MAQVQTLYRTQVLPINLREAWDFFSNPMNLQEITPTDMRFEVLTKLPEAVYPGLILHYLVGVLPFLKLEWVTEITVVREPEYFVDEQRMGPYRLWHHEHRFRPVPGGVEMEDRVHYALPFGALGRWAAGRWVDRKLERIFDFRRHVLAAKFPGAGKPA